MPPVARVLDAVQRASGIIIATPTYHAGISGLMKNLLDHFEHLRQATPPYLEGKLIGCIVTGGGTQGGAMTLSALRAVVHALRGWPTPLGVVVDPAGFLPSGEPASEPTATQLVTMAEQVMSASGASTEQENTFHAHHLT